MAPLPLSIIYVCLLALGASGALASSLDQSSANVACKLLLENQNLELPDYSQWKTATGSETSNLEPELFQYRDDTYRFEFVGIMLPDQVLFINAILVNKEYRLRSRHKGSVLYDQMIAHFGADNINIIEDSYYVGSINQIQYHRARAQGLSQEDAVRATWAAQQAIRNGFSVIFDIKEGPSRSEGAYPQVSVRFKKP